MHAATISSEGPHHQRHDSPRPTRLCVTISAMPRAAGLRAGTTTFACLFIAPRCRQCLLTHSCRDRSTPPGSSRRSRSCRIRPIAPCSSSSSRRGRIRVVRNGIDSRKRFSQSRAAASRAAASAACSASRSRPITHRADASTSTSRTRRATRSSRDSRRSSDSDSRRSFVQIRSAAGGDAASHQPALRKSQRRTSCVRARWISLHRPRRRRLGQRPRPPCAEPERAARQDAAHRCQRARQRRVRLQSSTRQPVSRREHRPRRDLGVRPAQPVALQLRRRGARRHGRAGDRRRRTEPVEKKSTTSRAAPAAATTAGATAKGRATTSRRVRCSLRRRIRFSNTGAAMASR